MSKIKICKYCQEGRVPKVLSDGRVEHWIVKSIIPARINCVACKEPDRWLALQSQPETSPATGPEVGGENG